MPSYLGPNGLEMVSRLFTIDFAKMIVKFCLLEQIMPEGPDHPFAKTMLAHFEKHLSTLKSIHTYPLLSDQILRFKALGWARIEAQSLWDLWNSDAIPRQSLSSIEQFDEWEEFVLFASHYLILVASEPASEPFPKPGHEAIKIRPSERIRGALVQKEDEVLFSTSVT